MLQRIQTLFLSIVIIAFISLFFFPVADYLSDFNYYKFYIYEFKCLTKSPDVTYSFFYTLPLVLLSITIPILAFFTIINYKKRLLQLKVNKINILLNIVLVILFFFIYAPAFEKSTNISPDYLAVFGIYLPLASLVFLVLANRSIQKDEKLIRSTERLR